MRAKLGAVLRIIIFSIIAIVLIRILTGGIGLNLFSKYRKPAASQSSGTVISEGTPIHGEDVEKLDISWVSAIALKFSFVKTTPFGMPVVPPV